MRALLLAATALVASCGAVVTESQRVVTTASAESASTPASPTTPMPTTSAPSASATADRPLPSATSLAPIPCVVVAQALCASAELIHLRTPHAVYALIGLRLPVGTAIYAPVDQIDDYTVATGKYGAGSAFSGQSTVAINDRTNPTVNYIVRGDITLETGIGACRSVRTGTQVGTIRETGAFAFSRFNLTLDVQRPTSTGFSSEEDVLRRLFPSAYARPAVEVMLETVGASGITTVFQCR